MSSQLSYPRLIKIPSFDSQTERRYLHNASQSLFPKITHVAILVHARAKTTKFISAMISGSEQWILGQLYSSQMCYPLACSFNELSTSKQDIVSQVSPSLPRSLRFDRWLLHRADRRHRLEPSLYPCIGSSCLYRVYTCVKRKTNGTTRDYTSRNDVYKNL